MRIIFIDLDLFTTLMTRGRCVNKRMPILALFILFAVLTLPSHGASGAFSGRIWNDLNRDGIQDVDEPAMSNFPITVYNDIILWLCGCPGFICPLATFYTDVNGYYDFTFSSTNESCPDAWFGTNQGFYVVFDVNCITYGHSPENAGGDDDVDSDYSYCGFVVTNEGFAFTNMDLGLYRWRVGVSLDMSVSNAHAGTQLYVTNGTKVTYTYRAVNTGDTFLSFMAVTDDKDAEFIGIVDCPASIPPGEAIVFATQRWIQASVTNVGFVSVVPVDPETCAILPTYDPAWNSDQAVVIVVTNLLDHNDGDIFPNAWEILYGLDPLNSNAPDINNDSDWMSNYEEYLAGTNPTNPASFFPNITVNDAPPDAIAMVVSTSMPDRVYNVWQSTNLLNDPQFWSLLLPEQTGINAALTFTITNDLPGAHYRTGVRLP